MTPALVLVGPPAAGKTTVGTAVAAALGVGFTDTDAGIETDTGRTVRALFAERGEAQFRELEEQAVSQALREHPGVLALGGGAVTTAAVRDALGGYVRSGGTVVWLDVAPTAAALRVGDAATRPLLAGNPVGRLTQLITERAPLYAEVCTVRVTTTDRPTSAVVTDVLAGLADAVPGGTR